MLPLQMEKTLSRWMRIAAEVWRKSWKTIHWLLKIMIPVTVAVNLLQYYGVIEVIAEWLNPLMRLAGLPGHSAVAFLTGAIVGTYGGLAALVAMDFTLREATIVATMVCLCHGLPMESAVIKKTGSSLLKMSVLRFVLAIVAAFFLNVILPEMGGHYEVEQEAAAAVRGTDYFLRCLEELVKLCLMVVGIIYSLMALQRIIDHYGVMDKMTRPLRPLMRFFGLPENATYMWIVGNVLGISYGCAVMLDLEERGQITRAEANEVNYHLIMNHSMVEDTLVFASFGIPAQWILFVRVLFALLLVWTRKALKSTLRLCKK